ncbi:winged helix-turn-helix domain-containing protein [Streptomyces sp. NPDC001056]
MSGLLSTLHPLHPLLVWEPPVLTVHGPLGERDLHLDGRGVLLLPSYFCWGAHMVLRDSTLPPVVVYPMAHRTGTTLTPDTRGEPAGTSLEGLIGRTRAAILRNAVGGRTTTALARAAGVSPGTASHRPSVLREAGLVTTRRKGPSVLHVATPLRTGPRAREGRSQSWLALVASFAPFAGRTVVRVEVHRLERQWHGQRDRDCADDHR